ncbi:MAG: hypothetical protein BGP09_36775 [Rhizobium sp. 60-20]|nr:MAG: hypothetical protein BGP09_36775 [Rhizobium sp. 60-20]
MLQRSASANRLFNSATGTAGSFRLSTNRFFLCKVTIWLDFDKPICYPAYQSQGYGCANVIFLPPGAAVAAGINQTKGT